MLMYVCILERASFGFTCSLLISRKAMFTPLSQNPPYGIKSSNFHACNMACKNRDSDVPQGLHTSVVGLVYLPSDIGVDQWQDYHSQLVSIMEAISANDRQYQPRVTHITCSLCISIRQHQHRETIGSICQDTCA